VKDCWVAYDEDDEPIQIDQFHQIDTSKIIVKMVVIVIEESERRKRERTN
jgi:hypothetical protein